MAKHTPGPWETYSAMSYIGVRSADAHKKIAGIQLGANDDSNARLIAAAPDLLDALEDCRLLLINCRCPVDWLDAVIARATGASA